MPMLCSSLALSPCFPPSLSLSLYIYIYRCISCSCLLSLTPHVFLSLFPSFTPSCSIPLNPSSLFLLIYMYIHVYHVPSLSLCSPLYLPFNHLLLSCSRWHPITFNPPAHDLLYNLSDYRKRSATGKSSSWSLPNHLSTSI